MSDHQPNKRKYNKRVPLISNGKVVHGESHTKLHQAWCSMIQRCKDENHHKYHRYGGRGIKVCDEWHTYTNFRDWARSNGFANDLTIDRINNDGNYEPSNCRWTTGDVQKYNRSNNHLIEHKGETKALGQWATQYNINPETLRVRIKSGWDIERALTYPNRQKGKVPYEKRTYGKSPRPVVKMDLNGQQIETFRSVREAALNTGISEKGLYGHCVVKKRDTEYKGFKWKLI